MEKTECIEKALSIGERAFVIKRAVKPLPFRHGEMSPSPDQHKSLHISTGDEFDMSGAARCYRDGLKRLKCHREWKQQETTRKGDGPDIHLNGAQRRE